MRISYKNLKRYKEIAYILIKYGNDMLKIDIKKNSNKKEININRKINLNEKTTNKKEDNKMFFYKTVYVIFLITVAIIGTYYIFKDIDQRKKEIIEKALLKHKSFNKAGKALGLTHNTVAAKVKKYGLKFFTSIFILII